MIKRGTKSHSDEDGADLRRGPWTLDEDNLLIKYITSHGEGRWNSLAKFAGLQRTGKSCRLRWLNYLKPDIKRGNLSPDEQLLILELHSKWGNRWSKIAQHMPGRTDNEIKNYWRTRVQKQARQLKLDSNSNKFLEAVRMFWRPRLMEHNSETQKLPETVYNDDGKVDDCYHVDYTNTMQELEECHDISLSSGHVAETDWLQEDLWSTFLNTDELWQFRNNEEPQIGVGVGFAPF